MKLIAHRGNISGPSAEENSPKLISKAISLGYAVEVDVRLIDGQIYLGHDRPQYKVSKEFFFQNSNNIYVHCKNAEALNFFSQNHFGVNYFFHEEDEYTMTSKGNIWIHPKAKIIKGGIIVMPEKRSDMKGADLVMAICSDYVEKFKNENQ